MTKAARRSFSEGGLPGSGAIAQLGERLLCKQEVVGSIPSGSTKRKSGVGKVRREKSGARCTLTFDAC